MFLRLEDRIFEFVEEGEVLSLGIWGFGKEGLGVWIFGFCGERGMEIGFLCLREEGIGDLNF